MYNCKYLNFFILFFFKKWRKIKREEENTKTAAKFWYKRTNEKEWRTFSLSTGFLTQLKGMHYLWQICERKGPVDEEVMRVNDLKAKQILWILIQTKLWYLTPPFEKRISFGSNRKGMSTKVVIKSLKYPFLNSSSQLRVYQVR